MCASVQALDLCQRELGISIFYMCRGKAWKLTTWHYWSLLLCLFYWNLLIFCFLFILLRASWYNLQFSVRLSKYSFLYHWISKYLTFWGGPKKIVSIVGWDCRFCTFLLELVFRLLGKDEVPPLLPDLENLEKMFYKCNKAGYDHRYLIEGDTASAT